MGVKKVEIEIEELSLHGFARSDRFRLADSIKRELARLIAERGMERPAGLRAAVAKMDAGSFQVSPAAEASGIGKQVARSVHSALGKAGRK